MLRRVKETDEPYQAGRKAQQAILRESRRMQEVERLTDIEVYYLGFLRINDIRNEPDFVTQAEAYRRFKRSNVDRWARHGAIKRYYRGDKSIQYVLDELKKAASNRQDYLLS